MNSKKIRALFPLKAELTQEVIGTSDTGDIYNCPGARTLSGALPQKLAKDAIWATTYGFVTGKLDSVRITTEEGIDFTKQKTPVSVTFKVYDYEQD